MVAQGAREIRESGDGQLCKVLQRHSHASSHFQSLRCSSKGFERQERLEEANYPQIQNWRGIRSKVRINSE